MKVSMVLGDDTVIEILVKFKSAPETAMLPSTRGNTVEIPPASAALPFKRNQPAVPTAKPLKLQTPDLATTPADGAAKVKPFVAVPGVNAPEFKVTVPSRVPVVAASAVAGWVPE